MPFLFEPDRRESQDAFWDNAGLTSAYKERT